ncbi:MAG: hypothetical protein V1688_01905 [bacterium]
MNLIPYIIIGGLITSILIVGFAIFSLRIGEKSIFHGSGAPTSMAQMLLSSVHVTSQNIIGILIIVILSLLITGNVLTTESGMPLLSVIIGYLLGKNFKDVSFTPQEKKPE